jgi:hypothetical protein
MSLVPVCFPFKDHSVSPCRMMNTRGVVIMSKFRERKEVLVAKALRAQSRVVVSCCISSDVDVAVNI